jgi:polar amino acid transport system substrate-binding protein
LVEGLVLGNVISRRLALLGLLGACLSAMGQAWAADGVPQPLRLFTGSQTPPKTYLDHDKPVGYIIDISTEALRRAGYVAEIDPLPWARAVAEADAGDGAITGFSRTAERERRFDYSDLVLEDRVVLVTRRGADFPFNSLKDLANRTIGMQRGSSYGPELEAALGTFHPIRDSGHCERLKMLAAGRIDGAIVSGRTASAIFNTGSADIDVRDLVIHDTPVAIDPNYIAIAKSRPDAVEILDRVNEALAGMAQDGTTRRIVAGYESGF